MVTVRIKIIINYEIKIQDTCTRYLCVAPNSIGVQNEDVHAIETFFNREEPKVGKP